jgi:hypothetical protein
MPLKLTSPYVTAPILAARPIQSQNSNYLPASCSCDVVMLREKQSTKSDDNTPAEVSIEREF